MTAAAVALGVAGPAFAVNPDVARKGCEFTSDSDRARQIQTCTFYSNALGRDVNVQIRPSSNAEGETEQGVYFLDGIGANNDRNTWANPDVGEVDAFSKNVNLVLPAGGAGEWATNWQGDKVQNGVTTKGPQWDTFLGQELPEYLNENFDVQKNNNAIVGVSMSGGPAIITALNNPTVFAVARSFSGFYQTDNAVGTRRSRTSSRRTRASPTAAPGCGASRGRPATSGRRTTSASASRRPRRTARRSSSRSATESHR